jgi:hypothetical protein
MGLISDPFGEAETEVRADEAGVIVGRTKLPVVNEGDALFHVAQPARDDAGAHHVAAHRKAEPLFDEDEII